MSSWFDPPPDSEEVCFGAPLPTDPAGNVRCELVWSLPAAADAADGVPVHCSDRDYLEPTTSDDDGREACIVRHLNAEQQAAGDVAGWYYDSNAAHACGVNGSLHFGGGISTFPDVFTRLSCQWLLAADEHGELAPVDVDECAAPRAEAGAHGVGDACTPALVPTSGFDSRQAYVQTASPECETGTCMVVHVDGELPYSCDAGAGDGQCASPAELRDKVYCTCRCDAPAGSGIEACDCPDGFVCVDVLHDAPDLVRGSYCVHNEDLTR